MLRFILFYTRYTLSKMNKSSHKIDIIWKLYAECSSGSRLWLCTTKKKCWPIRALSSVDIQLLRRWTCAKRRSGLYLL